MNERPAMEIEELRPEVAGEPRVARQDHERPDPAFAAPFPGTNPQRREDEADDAVGHDEGEVAGLVRDPLGHDSEDDGAEEQREPQEPHGR